MQGHKRFQLKRGNQKIPRRDQYHTTIVLMAGIDGSLNSGSVQRLAITFGAEIAHIVHGIWRGTSVSGCTDGRSSSSILLCSSLTGHSSEACNSQSRNSQFTKQLTA